MAEIKIHTPSKDLTVTAEAGERLLDVLRRAGVNVTAPCGGLGRCGKCRAIVNGEEVLACRYTLTGNAEITVQELAGGAILGGETEASGKSARLGAALEHAKRQNDAKKICVEETKLEALADVATRFAGEGA